MCPRKYVARSVKPVVLEPLPDPICKKTLEIKDSDAVIAAYLISRGYETGRKASENRELIANLAATEDKKLVREWSLKIILPAKAGSDEVQEIRASVTNTMSLKDLLSSLEGRGYEFGSSSTRTDPLKKVAFVSNGKIISSLDKLTSKSTLNIIVRP